MRLLIINRWDDDFADYGQYIDHQEHQVAYVTTADHSPFVPSGCRHVEIIEDPDDVGRVVDAAARCHDALGGIDRVLALSEFDLLTAAEIREKLSIPGQGTETTLLFRDKTKMKLALGTAGLKVPAFRAIDTAEEIEFFARTHGGAIVVKPRTGAASKGCIVLPEGADISHELSAGTNLSHHEVEEFLTGPIWHVDGLMRRGAPLLALASRYINTCYDFLLGQPLGSVVQSGPVAERVSAFAVQCLSVLGLRNGAFHVEVIEHADGMAFLEVGARVGGGEIPFVLRDVYGVDLIGDWIHVELGDNPQTVPVATPHEYAGFLMLPEPIGRRIRSRPSMVGRIPGLYDEVLPAIGHVFDGKGGYNAILGRFRYRGATPEAVEQAVYATLADYAYVLEDCVGPK